MASLPFGLSIHHFVSSVGADAGFAALVAVAILVLLYFAQARETATLRQRADEAGLRVQELEGQLADLADQVAALPAEISVRAASPRAAAAYGGAPFSGAQVPVGAMAGMALGGGLPPAAPAGMAAPALAAATRLIPDPELPVGQHAPATAALNGPPPSDITTVGAPPPATAAAGTNGSAQRPAAATMPRPVSAAVGAPPGRGPGGPAGPPPRTGPGSPRTGNGGPGRGPAYGRPGGAPGPRPTGPGGPRPARPQGAPLRPPPRRSRGRLVLGALVAVLGLAAVAAAVLVLSSAGSSSSASKSSAARAALASHRAQAANAAVVPSRVIVSVLNGTDMTGLAGRVSQRLTAAGYRQGAVADASDQTHTTSIIAYLSPAYRRDALAVASSLKLGAATVQQVDSGTEKIACTADTTACNGPVYVTAGRDLAAH